MNTQTKEEEEVRSANKRKLTSKEIRKLNFSQNTKGAHSSGNRSTSEPRLYSQLREVSVDPFSSPRVPRVLDKLENNEILPTSDEGSQSARSVQISLEGEPNLTTPSLPATRVPRVLPTGSVVSPPALQASTELLNPTSSV